MFLQPSADNCGVVVGFRDQPRRVEVVKEAASKMCKLRGVDLRKTGAGADTCISVAVARRWSDRCW
jgi:hypothetical protein